MAKSLAFLAAVLAVPGFAVAAESCRPNIVVILADDLGYADLGCQGCKDIPSPRIDSIAKNGVRFTDGYVTCPVCSPTRAGLMTGRYQQRFGHELNPGPPEKAEAVFGLPFKEKTMANHLKAAGYVTGLVGKWHLGLTDGYFPTQRGFDQYYGFLHGAHPYLYGSKDQRKIEVFRGRTVIEEKEYLTAAFAREAVSFIDRHRQAPFFLYLAFNAVHLPLEVTQKYLDRFPQIQDPKRRTYAAMLSAMDDAVGAVLDKLRAAGPAENTLIFFVSDNGGPTAKNTSRNDPLRGYKDQLLEGGIRVPFLVQWKNHLPAGAVYHHPVSTLDIVPTALAAGSVKSPGDLPLDGVDLLPYLNGKSQGTPHQALYWRYGDQWAIRTGNWKLVQWDKEPAQLYDLGTDIGESRNLAQQRPDSVKELTAAWQAWNQGLVRPLWTNRGTP